MVVLERLAHTDADLLPGDLQLAQFEFADPIVETKVEELAALPPNWRHDTDATRQIGRHWRQQGPSCLLAVPSAILPQDTNYMLNPEHPCAQGAAPGSRTAIRLRSALDLSYYTPRPITVIIFRYWCPRPLGPYT